MNRSLLSMSSKLNATPVDVEELLLATREVHKLPTNDRGWEARLHLMARLFAGKPDKGLAIEYRIQAMDQLLASGALPSWSMPKQEDGSVLIAEPVWKAAAVEPLLLRGKTPYFDKEQFLTRALALAEPEGDA